MTKRIQKLHMLTHTRTTYIQRTKTHMINKQTNKTQQKNKQKQKKQTTKQYKT